MSVSERYGTFGFRFSESASLAMCYLFAVGYDCIETSAYHWDGLTRSDGPLLLFQYTVKGEGILQWGQQKEPVREGKAFLVEIPGDHRYWHEEGAEPWEFYFLLIRPAWILPNWMEVKSRLGTVASLPPNSGPVKILMNIYAEAQAGRITDPYVASSYVYQFLAELGRYSYSDKRNREEWPVKIRMAAQYIDQHYSRMISLEELGDKLLISKYHLQRLFTDTAGLSPHEYLNRVRIKRAMELLHQTPLSMEEIASQVGFSSGSYFIRVFAKLTGMTPGAFRSGQENLIYNRLYID